jgi:hypothetical protein
MEEVIDARPFITRIASEVPVQQPACALLTCVEHEALQFLRSEGRFIAQTDPQGESQARTQYGHILGTRTYHSAPDGTIIPNLQALHHQRLNLILNRLKDLEGGPEKAGVGGSIPSLATI